jgi:hypothetical protein
MQTFFSNILTLMGDPHMATGHVPPGTTMHPGAAFKQHGIYKHMCNFLVIANILCIFIICDHHIYALQVSFAQTRTLLTCSVVVSWFFASGYVFHTQQPEPCVSLTTPLQRKKIRAQCLVQLVFSNAPILFGAYKVCFCFVRRRYMACTE